MIISFRAIIFFSFIASTNLIPMDKLPIQQKKIWDTPQLQEALKETIFANQPKELIFPILIMMPPQEKNNLRRTCTLFNFLLSFENVQPFMLCKELNAYERDIKSLYICANYNNDNNILEKLNFHPHVQSFFYEKEYDIIGSNFYIGIPFNKRKKTDNNHNLLLYNGNGQPSMQYLNPLLVAIISRNPMNVRNCLINLPFESISHESLDLYLCTIIQNNDLNTLNDILHYANLKIYNLSRLYFKKYIQLALYCCSDKIINQLIKLLKRKNVRDGVQNMFDASGDTLVQDYIGTDFKNTIKTNYIRDIVVNNLPKLRAMHPNREKLNYCLGVVLNNHLKELDLTSLEINNFYDRIKKEKELAENLKKIKNPKRKKYCSIQ